jgi:drug/metabolite transporter (DMT)-like permease
MAETASHLAPAKPDLGRGYAAALIGAALLATTGPFIRYLTQAYGLPALILAFWRAAFVTLTLLAVLTAFRPALLHLGQGGGRGGHLSFLAVYGLNLALFNSLWTLSISLNGAAVATVLAYSSAGFTALLGRWILKERLGWAKLLVVAVCLGGCVLVADALHASAWSANLLGILTGALSGLWYAIYSLMGRLASQRGLNPWTTLLYTFGFATIVLLAFNLPPNGFLPGAAARPADLLWLGDSWAGWGVLLLLAAGPTLTGYGAYNVSLSHLPSSLANLILTLEPPFTVVLAYVFLGERLTWTQIAGGLMILGGVVFLRLSEGRQTGP